MVRQHLRRYHIKVNATCDLDRGSSEMNRAVLAALAAPIAIACNLGIASAADMAAPIYTKAPAPVPFTWTGFYVGGHGGFAQGEFDFFTPVTTTPSEHVKGAFGGVQAGYNFQIRNVVLGLEADASFGKLDDLAHDGNYLTESTSIKAFGTARARAGYAFGQILPYVTGGLGWANATVGDACPAGALFGYCSHPTVGAYSASNNATYFGWTAGAGLEVAINQNWSVKAEYLHADLGQKLFTMNAPAFSLDPALKTDTGKIGVNYRFAGW
jgi:outer membrane immunogenic protein